MTARTSTEMLDALQRAADSGAEILGDLRDAINDRAIKNFGTAMHGGGAGRTVAADHQASLDHSMTLVEEHLHALLKEIGVAEHIVSYGVHRTPEKQGRNHLVL